MARGTAMKEPWDVAVDYAGAAIINNRPAMTREQRIALDRERHALRRVVTMRLTDVINVAMVMLAIVLILVALWRTP